MAYDGSITLSTKVDSSGIKQDAKKIANQYEAATQAVERQVKKVEELKARLSGLQSGEISVNDKGVANLQTQFDKTTASIEKTQAEINALYQQLDSLQANAFRAPDTGEVILTGKEQAQFDAINAKLDQLEPKLEADRQKAAELGEALKNATGTATQAEIDNTKQKLAAAETKLDGLKIKAEEAGNRLQAKMQESDNATSAVAAGFDKMAGKLMGMAKRVFVFAVITKALRALRSVVSSVIMSDTGFQNSLYQLQAAFWVAFAPIFNYVIPALKTLINWLTSAVIAVGKFIAMLTGKSYSAMVNQGKALQKRAAAYKDNAKGAGKAAKAGNKAAKATDKETKALEKQLAAFDELQILQEDKTDNASGGSDGGAGDTGGVSGGLAGAFDEISSATSDVSTNLSALHMIIGGFLATVGVMLLFTGNIGLGLGFIIAGITEFSIGLQSWSEQDYGAKISPQLESIMTFAGGALVAIGLILLTLGQVGWGLGAITIGITIWAVKELTSKPYDGSDIITMLMNLGQIASMYMLCIGMLVLLTPGNFLVGLGMIVSGIALLKFTTATLGNSESNAAIVGFFADHEALITGMGIAFVILGLLLCCCNNFLLGMQGIIIGAAMIWSEAAINNTVAKTQIENFFKENQGLIVGVSLSLLVIGILLCAAGVSLPIGIGLIAVGALALAEEAYLNWDLIKGKIDTFIDKNKGLIIGVSAAMLILGIILLCTGVGIPLGLGLVAAGGGILAKELVANWDFIKDKVKEMWEGIKSYWNNHIKKYFTAAWWGDLAKTSIRGFIKWFIDGLNKLINKINEFGFDMPDVLGGGHIGFNIPPVPVPRLARGAVIPPNREFMAILGDQKQGYNYEVPDEKLRQLIREETAYLANGSAGSETIILELDGREVGRTFGKAIQKEAARTGNNFVRTKLVFG